MNIKYRPTKYSSADECAAYYFPKEYAEIVEEETRQEYGEVYSENMMEQIIDYLNYHFKKVI